jgi:septation ring formation regulator EzrA
MLHTSLFMDLERLASDLYHRNLSLPNQDKLFNLEHQAIDDAIDSALQELKEQMKKTYVTLMSKAYSRVKAFEEAVKPLVELIQAVQARSILQHPIYSKIQSHLKQLESELLNPSTI